MSGQDASCGSRPGWTFIGLSNAQRGRVLLACLPDCFWPGLAGLGGPRRFLRDLLGFPLGRLWCSRRGWESHVGCRLACDSRCGSGRSSGGPWGALGVLAGILEAPHGCLGDSVPLVASGGSFLGPSGLRLSVFLCPCSRLSVQPEARLGILYPIYYPTSS